MACGAPDDGSHSMWTGITFGPGNTVTYTCNTGYRGVGSILNKTVTCKSNGEWSNKPLHCTGMYLSGSYTLIP